MSGTSAATEMSRVANSRTACGGAWPMIESRRVGCRGLSLGKIARARRRAASMFGGWIKLPTNSSVGGASPMGFSERSGIDAPRGTRTTRPSPTSSESARRSRSVKTATASACSASSFWKRLQAMLSSRDTILAKPRLSGAIRSRTGSWSTTTEGICGAPAGARYLPIAAYSTWTMSGRHDLARRRTLCSKAGVKSSLAQSGIPRNRFRRDRRSSTRYEACPLSSRFFAIDSM